MECISYKKGYKYQLFEEYKTSIDIKPVADISSTGSYVTLSLDGHIVIKKGYAWDGPSGPTVDTLSFMRGSLVHDALYQLMREDKLDRKTDRKLADKLLQEMCINDKMNKIRAWWIYQGIRAFGKKATLPSSKPPVIRAPEDCQ